MTQKQYFPKVSIITVSYNAVQTIEETIQSVICQTYPNIEYIIIDGGSTDGTVEIIKKYKDKIAYWVSEPDNGIYNAMNKGIQMATGDLIGIINSDDWYEADAVESVVEQYQKSNGMCILSGNMNLTRRNKNFIRVQHNKDVSSCICDLMPINHPATFVPKCIYEKIGLFDTKFKLSADYDFIFRAFISGITFIFVDKVIVNMRLGGATNGKGPEGLRNGFITAKENYLLRLKNTDKKFRMLYYKDVFILKVRQIKRMFIPSKYE